MKEFITCDLLGPGDGLFNYGLGNQMFQIATIYSHAKDNDFIATFPQLTDPKFGSYNQNVFSKVNTEPIYDDMFKYYQDPKFTYTKLPVEGNMKFRGYFQSEKYFRHNRDYILDLFKASDNITEYLNTKYNVIGTDTVAIHVRRGDYVHKQDDHPLCDVDYYLDGIFKIYDTTHIDKFLIFSDDIPYCKTIFHGKDELVFVENEKDYMDLYLMSMCKHHVIANSSFSWWGAWLGNDPEQIVVAPKKWFGKNKSISDIDIIPSNWIRL